MRISMIVMIIEGRRPIWRGRPIRVTGTMRISMIVMIIAGRRPIWRGRPSSGGNDEKRARGGGVEKGAVGVYYDEFQISQCSCKALGEEFEMIASFKKMLLFDD